MNDIVKVGRGGGAIGVSFRARPRNDAIWSRFTEVEGQKRSLVGRIASDGDGGLSHGVDIGFEGGPVVVDETVRTGRKGECPHEESRHLSARDRQVGTEAIDGAPGGDTCLRPVR